MRALVTAIALFFCDFLGRAESAATIELNTNSNLGVALSNAPNGTLIRIPAGIYPVVPSKVLSNGVGGINLFNKTNITIEGVPGATIIDGTSALGEIIYLTNSSHVTLRGLTIKGLVVTNYTLVSAIGHVWASLSMYAVDNITVENCRFIDGHDHGIHDMGAQQNWNTISTNNIVIRGNYFDNFGSARTNEVVVVDGTAIVPTGWTVIENEFRNCLRCIEPYSESDSVPNPFFNCVIRSNRMINTIDSAILTAGSTNGNQLLIEGNYIYNDPGYTRRGSNMYPGFGIELNDGHGHTIRGNQLINVAHTGIAIGGSARHVTDVLIESNVIENTDARNQGFGISAIAANGAEVRGLMIRNNRIRRAKNHSIYLLSTRDSVVEGNTIIDSTVLPGAAIKLSTYQGSSNSNVLIASNFISDATSKMTYGIEVTTNNHSIRVEDNCIEGATIYPIGNQAGSEVIFASRGFNCPAMPVKLKINEWLAFNSGILIDPADQDPDSCFEFHNAEEFSIDLSGYYLTDDISLPLKFGIPALRQCIVPPNGFLTVWADNETQQNTDTSPGLHANFVLNRAGGIIGLSAADATVIDSVIYGTQLPDVSEGFHPDASLERVYMSPPSLGGTNRINEVPTIVGTELIGSAMIITFVSKRGAKYQIVSNSSLDASPWTAIGGVIEAISTLTRVTNSVTRNDGMFFKVAIVP